jgi:pimeloyl-ACP methyl ester carboxylesterase
MAGHRVVPTALACLTLTVWFAGCSSRPPTGSSGPNVREESVTFRNGDVTLAGTLVIPVGPGRHPAVVLFHGSGPEGRNLGMARWFAAQGVAALAYDKRGVGESTGDFRRVPFMDLHLDGLAGLASLQHRRDINASDIGVWGLSQGGWLAPLAASRSRDVRFVIAVSGPAVSPGEQMVFYYANQLRAERVPEPDVQKVTTLRRLVWNAAYTGRDLARAKTQLDEARRMASDEHVRAQQDDLVQALRRPAGLWITQEMNYDPLSALRQLAVPSLFIFGQDDQLVPVEQSVDLIRRTLTETRHPDFTIKVFPGADHGIQVPEPDGSFRPAPEYFSAMRDWLLVHVSR